MVTVGYPDVLFLVEPGCFCHRHRLVGPRSVAAYSPPSKLRVPSGQMTSVLGPRPTPRWGQNGPRLLEGQPQMLDRQIQRRAIRFSWKNPPPRFATQSLHQPDDFELFSGEVSHSWSPPAPVMFFLSRRFSRLRSATSSFSAKASARRSFTSPVFAWRAVSPASRFLPASRNSLDQL